MKKAIFLVITSCLFAFASPAQHEHHMPMKDTVKPKAKDTTEMQMGNDTSMMHHDHSMMNHEMHMNMPMGNMSHSFSLNLPMSRNGSGTAWMPDAAPMYGNMYHSKSWMYMLHYNL